MLQVIGLPVESKIPTDVGNIYIREGEEGYTRKTWNYSKNSFPLSINLRVRNTSNIVLDLHMPIRKESSLMKKIEEKVQLLLSTQLLKQEVKQVRYPPDDELQIYSSNQAKQTFRSYDSGLQRNRRFVKNSKPYYIPRNGMK